MGDPGPAPLDGGCEALSPNAPEGPALRVELFLCFFARMRPRSRHSLGRSINAHVNMGGEGGHQSLLFSDLKERAACASADPTHSVPAHSDPAHSVPVYTDAVYPDPTDPVYLDPVPSGPPTPPPGSTRVRLPPLTHCPLQRGSRAEEDENSYETLY